MATGNFLVPVGSAACGKGMGLDPRRQIAYATDITNSLLNHTARAGGRVWVDVEMHLYRALPDGIREAKVEVGDLVDLIHQAQVRPVGPLVEVSFAGGLPEEFAAAVAVDVDHNDQGVVCVPDLTLQEPTGVRTNVNSGAGRLRCNETGHRGEVELPEGMHVGVHNG